MESAGVPKRVYRDSGVNSDVASASQSSSRWTVAQILTPILVAFSFGLAFILYILYKRGSLSRLFMRGVRRVRRQRDWEVDGGGTEFPHVPDAEATPMISQPHHWNSFFPRNATDRRLSSRIRESMATPSITAAFRSIRRLFGRGPIPVSRVPMPEAFEIESSDSETDPFDTLRSNASRAKLLRPRTKPKQTPTSGSDRAGSSYTLTNNSDGTRDSPLLDVDLDSDRVLDQGIANGVGGGSGTDDHDGDSVMLITRNGRDFSSGSTPRSLRSLAEVDQNSLEVVPPTPTQPYRHAGAYHSRSASTPHLHTFSDSPLLHSFSPSTGDLSSPRPPRFSPSLAQFASGNRSRPTRGGKDAKSTHHFTALKPPSDPTAPDTAPSPTSSLGTSPNQRTPHTRGAHSPTLSPQLQNYMPSFPGRSPPGSPYALPNSVPSSPISASDPQNLIPPAVRGAGYNPWQHARSVSDLGPMIHS